MVLIPGWGTKIPHAMQCAARREEKTGEEQPGEREKESKIKQNTAAVFSGIHPNTT